MAQRTWKLFAVFLSLVLSAVAHAAEKIGIASGVTNQVTGTVSGTQRTLRVGDDMFESELVETAEESNAQLLFRDETVFTVGPRSQVVLDKFVYDPRRGTGDIALSVARGAFRFVSGSAQSAAYQINTPVATIGVRGTMVEGYTRANGDWLFIVSEGDAVFCPTGQECFIASAGSYVLIAADGTVQVGTFEGSILNLIGIGNPFPLWGYWEKADNLEDIPNLEIRDLNDALAVPPIPEAEPEPDDNSGGGTGYIIGS